MNNPALKQKRMVTGFQKFSLGLGDLGYSLVVNTFSSYILFFGATVMGVNASLMGTVIALGTVWDAITDPIMGYISDNTRSRIFGRRHLYVLIGMFGMVVCNVLLWSVPRNFSSVAMAAWFAMCIIGMRTFTTMVQTPVSALSLDMAGDYNERSTIQIVKSVFMILGILLPTVLIGIFQTDFYRDGTLIDGRFNPDGYLNFGYVTGACCIVFNLIMYISTYSHVPRLNVVAAKDPVGPMNLKATPLWMYISKKFDKKKALIVGMFISLTGCVMLLIMFLARDFFVGLLHQNSINVIFMMPPLMVAGLGTGVLYSLPVALIGDVVILEKAATGEDKTATYTGFLTFGNKVGQALSSAILGFMLDAIGFQEGSTTQTPEVSEGLGWIMCIGVILAIGTGLFIFTRSKMTRADVQAAMDKLEQQENQNIEVSDIQTAITEAQTE